MQAVLCDLGGVVIQIDPDRIREQWARMSALPAADVYAAYPDEVYYEFERDELTVSEYVGHVRARLRLEGTDEEILAAFNALYIGADQATVELLRGLRERGVLMLALTNTNRAHHQVWCRRFAEVLGVFDRVHCSHDLGLRKPEPEVFRAVLDEHDLKPAEVVFIDDVRGHVSAAEAIGLDGVAFSDASALARQLAGFDWH